MNITMKYSCAELNDLPDEILLIIFKKLGNLEVLYSFQGVNERFNNIIHDPILTSRLSFPQLSFQKYIKKFSSDIILNRFCSQILPTIRTKIKWLDLESESMRNISVNARRKLDNAKTIHETPTHMAKSTSSISKVATMMHEDATSISI